MIQIGQTALANGSHTLEQRLARWLLMCHDRVDGDEVFTTHEFLSLMLGVRRAGVTDALKILEERGLISTKRGRVTVLDRMGLDGVAGDSYGVCEASLHAYLDGTGLANDPQGPLFRTIGRGTGRLTRTSLPQANAYAMIQRRAWAAGIRTGGRRPRHTDLFRCR
jgi:DNA-binding transcriptional MocR family regulator